ncbi:MAG: hypothetical protein IJ390_02765 [Lachnospiraceae bacterium]|nr:hypothetical protein [Lachnospiraceae bacterium]
MNYWTQSPQNIYVAAHRGWSEKYPENTMVAFQEAVKLGVDQLETDIRLTKDNELVLIHDGKVDRTTNGTGNVCDMTLAELQNLDAGSWKGEQFAGFKIPTLMEFLEFLQQYPKMTVDFEIKDIFPDWGDEITLATVDRILGLLDEYHMTERCVINTWSGRMHEYIHAKYGNKYKLHLYYPVHLMGPCTADPYEYGYCVCMFGTPGYIASKPEFDEMKQKYGIQTWAGAGVADAVGVDAAIERGAELITCNNPDVILGLLRERGYHR